MSKMDCKSCANNFEENVFLKHIIHSKKCSKAYSKEEVTILRTKAKEKAKQRNEKYKKENKEELAKKKSEYYKLNKDDIKAKQREHYSKKKADSTRKNEKTLSVEKTLCKVCGKYFKRNTLLKHITNSQKCQSFFTEVELNDLKADAYERAKLRNKEYKSKNHDNLRKKKRLYYLEHQEAIKADRKKCYYIKKCENEQNFFPDEEESHQKKSKTVKESCKNNTEEYMADSYYLQKLWKEFQKQCFLETCCSFKKM